MSYNKNNEVRRKSEGVPDIFYRDKLTKVQNEMQYLIKKYEINNHLVLSSISKKATYSKVYKEGNISKIADYIAGILNCLGFSKEEIADYFVKNKNIFNSNYADLRYRLALMYKAGLLEDCLFVNPFILTNEFTMLCISTKDLYSLVKYRILNNLPLSIESLSKVDNFNKLYNNELSDATNKCPFDANDFKNYDSKMMLYLSRKKLENEKKRVL